MIHKIALTIKPTLSCNMRCRHCFNGDDLNTSELINTDTVHNFLEIAAKQYNDVKVTFHGGEPTLAGFEFYKGVFQFQHYLADKYGTVFSNNFTTNGLILDDRMIELLIENNVLINISFDGPFNHVLRQNSDAVYSNICNAQKKGARIRIFCTISSESYADLLQIYNWFNDRNLDFKTLPIEPRGYGAKNKSLIMDPDLFVEELVKVYRHWLRDKDFRVRFYTFEEFSCLRRNTQFKPFWFNREIALNPDGNIYPFGRPNDVQFCLGNPNSVSSLDECFNSPEYIKMLDILNEQRKKFCTECESSQICNGVALCMSYMYVEQEELIQYSCRLSNKIFRNILAVNDEVINDFKAGKGDGYNQTVKKNFSIYVS